MGGREHPGRTATSGTSDPDATDTNNDPLQRWLAGFDALRDDLNKMQVANPNAQADNAENVQQIE